MLIEAVVKCTVGDSLKQLLFDTSGLLSNSGKHVLHKVQVSNIPLFCLKALVAVQISGCSLYMGLCLNQFFSLDQFRMIYQFSNLHKLPIISLELCMYQMQFCWGFFCWVFFVRGMHQDGVYNNYRMCKAPNDVLYSSPLHQTFGYHINSLLVVFNSTSRISSAWIILIKVMLKQKNANGDCHVFAIIFNTLLLQTFGLHITVTNLL